MNTRLQQFLGAENISQSQFADDLGMAKGSISHILAGRNRPSYDFIAGLMQRYPRLNIEWLMLGKGKMYKDMQPSIEAEVEPSAPENPPTGSDSVPSGHPERPQIDTAESPAEPNLFSAAAPQPAEDAVPSPTQSPVIQPTIKKVLILFDDGTYREI